MRTRVYVDGFNLYYGADFGPDRPCGAPDYLLSASGS